MRNAAELCERSRIDDIFLMAENLPCSPDQLLPVISQMLHVGLFILNGSFQRISGAAVDFTGNPYLEELTRTGALSPESVRAIRAGGEPAMLHEAASGKWSRFQVLVLWREGEKTDAPYLCRRLTDFVIDYRSRNIPPEIPPFLIDQRLNRILEGRTADERDVRSFFGVGDETVWFAVLVLGSEPGVRWNAEAYQKQAALLHSAFCDAYVTVVRAQVCAVVRIPVRDPKDAVFSRSFFNEHAYAEGWDRARLEQELHQCGVYLCCSSVFQSLHFFPVECRQVFSALDIAIRLDGCRGRRIVDFLDYNAFVCIQDAAETFLQKFDPRSARAVLDPELVTLLLYDIKNHTDLADVLYTYYIYGDVNQAAKALFVHRNTVYNKLKTIQKLLNADIDTPAVRGSFFSSLQIYYYFEKCLGLDLHTQE